MARVERRIVRHIPSGERYILEIVHTAASDVFRAAGPLRHDELPDYNEMGYWLNNQGGAAYDDGLWLSNQQYHDA